MTRLCRCMGRLGVGLCIVLLLGGLVSIEALFAPDAELWPRWQAHDPGSTLTVDHADWTRLLGTYRGRGPDGIARFAYAAVTPQDRTQLSAYLERLAAVAVDSLNRDEQRAYWVNLYNALTVDVVLEHYPVDSIRDIDISLGLFADGPWDAELVTVEGVALSLNDIEHRILRPIWHDPRLHYVLNCAALGCPDLTAGALSAEDGEAQLERAARTFVNHPRGVSLKDGRLRVSSIYVWFREDFGDGEADVIAHLRRYADPALAEALEGVTRLDAHAYDWRLNDAATATE